MIKTQWSYRGYLPHLDTNRPQTLTYRLADSLPREVLERLRREARNPRERRRLVERYLDAGHGSGLLARPDCAGIVRENLRHHDPALYRLGDWVIMPTHVHVDIRRPQARLRRITGAWKSYTGKRLKELTGRKAIWAPGYFDRAVRDEAHDWAWRRYVWFNPVAARLVDHPFDWEFSSVHECTDRRAVERAFKMWMARRR